MKRRQFIKRALAALGVGLAPALAIPAQGEAIWVSADDLKGEGKPNHWAYDAVLLDGKDITNWHVTDCLTGPDGFVVFVRLNGTDEMRFDGGQWAKYTQRGHVQLVEHETGRIIG